MKRISLLLSICALFAFSACNDNDDNKNYAEKVEGTYEGYSDATSGYFSNNMTIGESVVVTAVNDNTVNVKYTSGSWGTLEMNGATVTHSGGKYTIEGGGKAMMGMAGGQPEEKTYEMVATVTSSKEMTMTLDIPGLMNGTEITFSKGVLPDDKAGAFLKGTYSGYVTAKAAPMGNNGLTFENQTLKITANTDGTIDILYTHTDENYTWTFDVKDIEFTSEKGGVTVTASGSDAEMGMGGSTNTYAYTMTGTVVSKSEAKIKFTLPSVMGGFDIEFITGDAPEA